MAAADASSYEPRAGLIAPLPSAERGFAVVTSASPDGRFLLYANGTNVVVRDLADPAKVCVYAEHAHAVKCAKFSPTGKYIASGGEARGPRGLCARARVSAHARAWCSPTPTLRPQTFPAACASGRGRMRRTL